MIYIIINFKVGVARFVPQLFALPERALEVARLMGGGWEVYRTQKVVSCFICNGSGFTSARNVCLQCGGRGWKIPGRHLLVKVSEAPNKLWGVSLNKPDATADK